MDFYAVFTSPENGWFQTVERYVSGGGDVNQKHRESGWTLLHVASEYRQADTIRLLAKHGADTNARDHQGMTPLHWAVDADIDQAMQMGERISFSTTRTLVELGADQSIRDNRGETPRDIAADYGKEILALYDALTNAR